MGQMEERSQWNSARAFGALGCWVTLPCSATVLCTDGALKGGSWGAQLRLHGRHISFWTLSLWLEVIA